MLIQNRLDMTRSTVCWRCEDKRDFVLLNHIQADYGHWVILAQDLTEDEVNLLYNTGAYSLLPIDTPQGIIKFHVKKLEKQVWRNLNTFDPYEGVCYLFGTKVDGLTKKEIQLLKLFVMKDDYSISKDDVVKTIWKDILVNSKTLDVHFYNLRRKLSPYGIKIKLKRRGEWQLQL